MPSDRGEPWSGATYNGFAGPAPGDASPEPAPSVHRTHAWPTITRNRKLMAGVGAAVALGLVFGLWARAGIHRDGRANDPLSAQAEASVTPKVPIEVNQPVPPAAVRSAGRLDVLPNDMAQAARASAPMAAPRAPAALDRGADVAVISPQPLDVPPQGMTRAERRALRYGEPLPDPRFAPPPQPYPPMSRAERRALRDLEPLRADPHYVPPADEEADDDEGDSQ